MAFLGDGGGYLGQKYTKGDNTKMTHTFLVQPLVDPQNALFCIKDKNPI